VLVFATLMLIATPFLVLYLGFMAALASALIALIELAALRSTV
jgi:hypothetical protein